MTLQKFLSSPSSLSKIAKILLTGENPYIEKKIKEFYKSQGAEVKSFSVPKSGLSSEMIESSQGGSLFNPLTLLYLKFSSSTSSWKVDALNDFEELLSRADPQQLVVVFQVPNDKRIKWDGLKADLKAAIEEMDFAERLAWIEKMNIDFGSKLDSERLHFLATLEGDLLQIESYLQLWSLGGDLWAQDNLSWNSSSLGASLQKVQGGAFEWVDFVFQRKNKEASLLLKDLLDQGEDTFKLLALLSKSARILSMIEMNKNLSGQAPFLIQKLKRVRGKSGNLLKLCREADLAMKSSSVNARAMLQRLRF